MISPYASKTRESWRQELDLVLDVLAERNVDFSISRTVSAEFSGKPDARLALVAQLAQERWESMRGIGTEPDETVFVTKVAAWSGSELIATQGRLFDAAQIHGVVFEGLCYHCEESML